MSYAVLNPEYKDLLLAIPPPPGFKLPPQLQDRYNALQKQPGVLEQALKDFIETAQSYYAEVRSLNRRKTPYDMLTASYLVVLVPNAKGGFHQRLVSGVAFHPTSLQITNAKISELGIQRTATKK